MERFFEDYFQVLQTLVKDFQAAVSDLPQAGLDWSPGPETNSLAVLAAHTAGSLRYWIGDVVIGESSHREREVEFRTHGLGGAVLAGQLQASLDYTRAALTRLGLADLEGERIAPHDGRKVTCGWALLHALEHTAQHVAHAQLTRQLWEAA